MFRCRQTERCAVFLAGGIFPNRHLFVFALLVYTRSRNKCFSVQTNYYVKRFSGVHSRLSQNIASGGDSGGAPAGSHNAPAGRARIATHRAGALVNALPPCPTVHLLSRCVQQTRGLRPADAGALMIALPPCPIVRRVLTTPSGFSSLYELCCTAYVNSLFPWHTERWPTSPSDQGNVDPVNFRSKQAYSTVAVSEVRTHDVVEPCRFVGVACYGRAKYTVGPRNSARPIAEGARRAALGPSSLPPSRESVSMYSHINSMRRENVYMCTHIVTAIVHSSSHSHCMRIHTLLACQRIPTAQARYSSRCLP